VGYCTSGPTPPDSSRRARDTSANRLRPGPGRLRPWPAWTGRRPVL